MPRLVLSPHLDDAVFSVFHALGQGAIVATLCTGLPDAGTAPSTYDNLTLARDPAVRYEQRRKEDLAVAAEGGWRPIHYGLLDSPYRKDDPDPADIAGELLASVEVDDVSELWIPAGISGHRDHILTRDVGFEARFLLQCPVRLYADLPYATNFGWPSWITGTPSPTYLDIDAFWRRWLPLGIDVRSDATVHRLDERQQGLKLHSCAGYRTQFTVSDSGPSRLLSHPERIPVEVSWLMS